MLSRSRRVLSRTLSSKAVDCVPAAAYLPQATVLHRVLEVVKSFKYDKFHPPVSSSFAHVHFLRFVPSEISSTAALSSDLGFDSMHHHELMEKLSNEFCVKVEPQDQTTMLTIPAVTAYFSTHPKAR